MKRVGVEMYGYDSREACGEGYELKRGREIHGSLVVNGYGLGLVVMTCAVNMYVKCGRVKDAYKNGYAKVALELMIRMQEERKRPDWITVVSILLACADICSVVLGKSVHGYAMRTGFDSFLNVSTALMDMYSKFGAAEIARSIFDGLDGKRTMITWNCMIDGYVQNGDPEEALKLFRRIDLESGKFIHELLDQMDLGSDVQVINSLISMYSKCKNVDVAVQLFSKLQNKNLASWNAMISGFSQIGHVKEALNYLRKMFVSRIKIDCFTFGGINKEGKEEDEPLLEDENDEDEDDDDNDDDNKDEDGAEGGEHGDGSGRSKQSRSEKKSRKAMLKLDMKPITESILFVISKPDVFKSPTSDTYVIFGEPKIEDLSSQLQTQAVDQFKAPDLSHVISKPESSALAQDDDEEVDETGVEPKDTELVMTQAGVSRSKAVKALKAVDGDIVSAIMELTN
ncbi:Pentatricopeptide repeat-containing protein [Drosera capensis]